MFNGEYLYYIGANASEEIIAYSTENSSQQNDTMYENAIIGNIVEITDDYILVDDSVLCEDPDKGIIFKVHLNDIRIGRYVELNYIAVGDTVKIQCKDRICVDSDYVLRGAISILKATIANKDIIIPE